MGENNRLPGPGKSRKTLMTLTAMSVVGMIVLIGMLWLSEFPGTPKDVSPKSEAPPEDVRRAE